MPNKFAVALLLALDVVLLCFLVALLFAAQAAFAQIPPTPIVKLAWDPYPNAIRYDLWRASLATDAAGNDSCVGWRKLGNTGGLWALDTKAVSGGRYCYAIQAEVTLDGVLQSTELSDPPAVAEIP